MGIWDTRIGASNSMGHLEGLLRWGTLAQRSDHMVGFGLGLDCIGIGCLLSPAQLAVLDCVGWPQSLSAPASDKREKKRKTRAMAASARWATSGAPSPPPSGDWRLATGDCPVLEDSFKRGKRSCHLSRSGGTRNKGGGAAGSIEVLSKSLRERQVGPWAGMNDPSAPDLNQPSSLTGLGRVTDSLSGQSPLLR